MNSEKYIKMLVTGGYDAKTATEKVNTIITKVQELLPGEKPDVIENAVTIKIKEMAMVAKNLTKLRIITVGVSDSFDFNDRQKREALDAYKQNPTIALQEGMIQIIDGNPIPIDNREFVDRDRTMENWNYGKPIQERMGRVYFLLDVVAGRIVNAFGNVPLKPGTEYTIFAKVKNNIINIQNVPAPILVKTLQQNELWTTIHDASSKSEISCDLEEVPELPDGVSVITEGTVSTMQETSNGSIMIALLSADSSDDTGIAVFCNSESMKEAIAEQNITQGSKVLVCGRKSSSDNGTNISGSGILKSPGSDIGKALSALDKIIY